MAEDLDAELEDYWKGSVGEDNARPKKLTPLKQVTQTGGKRMVSLTGKSRLTPTPKKGKVVSLKGTPKQSDALDHALTPRNDKKKKEKPQIQKKKKTKSSEFYKNLNNQRQQSNPFHPQSLARCEQRPDPETVTFPGKTKLFIGGLPEDYTQTQVQELLEVYGEIVECYVPTGKAFAIITFASRESAYKAQTSLSGKTLEDGRTLRVRPSPDAAVWVGDLPSIATNELLKQAFSRFGPINRAVVCCDTRGRPLGYGIVEYAYKGSATNCIETCTTQPFLLSRSPQPVRVEPFRYKENDVGLPAKEVLLDRYYWQMIESECNGPGPRMGDGSEPIANEWIKLYQQQKIAKQALKEKFQEERKLLLEKQNKWFQEEEMERLRQSEDIRNQRMEIMRREEQLRSTQAQLNHATAQVGFGAW